MQFEVALFDMAGTTVQDYVEKKGHSRLPLVLAAYEDAFAQADIHLDREELNACRGRDKKEVFNEKVNHYRADLSGKERSSLAEQLHSEFFVPSLLRNVEYLEEMPGARETFTYLKDKGIFVATGSGFPHQVTQAILDHLKWEQDGLIDYATCGEVAGGGRPQPHMIHDVLIQSKHLSPSIDRSVVQADFDYQKVLKVGDTVIDIEEGRNVGAYTIGVYSGTQDIGELLRARPDAVLHDVSRLTTCM